ncbi:MAG: TPM domain-containing protein [Candidatus Poseidoniaceae archaeon]|nr:TPM domain-containing protein [Candidatus Poseidoniaceae archaeon]
MSQFSKVVLLAIITILLLPAVQAEQTFPVEPEGEWYVLDAADVLDNQTEMEMSSELSDIRNRTNTLVRVVTIESMADYGVEEGRDYFMGDEGYARQMFQHYGMEGNEEKAILITFSEQDRKFKFVMPDHTIIQQQKSGEVYEYSGVKWALSEDLWEEGTWNAIYGSEEIIDVEAVDDLIVLAMFLIPFVLLITLLYLAYNKAKRYKTTGLEAVIAEQRMIQEMTKARGMKVMEHLQEKESGTFQMEFLDQLNTVTEGYPYPDNGPRDYAKEAIVYKIKKEFDKASIGINTRADELGIGYDLPLEYAETEQDIIELNKFEAFAKATFPLPFAFGLILPAVIGFFNLLDGPMDSSYFFDDLSFYFVIFFVVSAVTFFSFRGMKNDRFVLFPPMAFLVNKSTVIHTLKTSGWDDISSNRLSSGIVLTGMTTAMIVSPRWTVTVSGVDEYGNSVYDYDERSYSSGGGGSSCGSSCGGGCGGGGCGGGGDF